MNKYIRLLKKRRFGGFTLVEMIVAIAMLAILMAGMMIFISPIIQSYNGNHTDSNAQNTTTCVQEYISRKLRNSYQVAIFENTNYAAIRDNDAYKSQIESMNEFCANVNGPSAVNKTYVLKCMSLRYDSADQRYYLWDESVNMNSKGALDQSKSKKVFADVLYNNLYITYDFSLPKNGDFITDPSKGEFRKDALQMDFKTYRDPEFSSLIFQGQGITEMRQIKGMLADGGNSTNYFVKVEPETPLDYNSMVDGERDIYIYYVTRVYGSATTP